MNFYYNFLRLCNEVGKSPSKVILEVGGTKSAITRWKNGGTPTDATVQKIANYFGVSADSLKSVEKIEKPADQKADGLRGTGYYELTPENRAMIDSLIDSLLKSQSAE